MEDTYKLSYMLNIQQTHERLILPPVSSNKSLWIEVWWKLPLGMQYVNHTNNSTESYENKTMFLDLIQKMWYYFFSYIASLKATICFMILGSVWVHVWYKNQVTALIQRVLYEIEEQLVRFLASCRKLPAFADNWDGLLLALNNFSFLFPIPNSSYL